MTTVVKGRRKSTNEPDELPLQDLDMDRCIAAKGWTLLHTPLTLLNVERDRVEKYLEQYLLRPLKQLKPDFLLFRDSERVGIIEADTYFWFLKELRNIGVKLYYADPGREVDTSNIGNAFQEVTNVFACADSQLKISRKVLNGREQRIKDKNFVGSLPAYGYDWAILNRNGELKYRIVYDGYKVFNDSDGKTGHHKRRVDSLWKINEALCRAKVYPDGKVERFDDEWLPSEDYGLGPWKLLVTKPTQDMGDRKTILPNEQRAPIVREIYRLADMPLWKTPYEIACELNKQGIPPFGLRPWSQGTISCILNNPIYSGKWIEGRTNRSKIERYKAFEVELNEQEQERIRLVEESQWQRVQNHLKQKPPEIYERKRRSNHHEFWARNFLQCGNCNASLYIQASNPWRKSNCYRCQKCSSVNVGVIHTLIDEWAAWLNPKKCSPTKELSACLTQLMGDGGAVGNWNMWATKMANYSIERMPGDTQEEKQEAYRQRIIAHAKTPSVNSTPSFYFKTEPYIMPVEIGTDSVEAIYLEEFEKDNAPKRKEVADIETELNELYVFAKNLKSNELLACYEKDATELGEKKRNLEASMVSLLPEYRREKQRIAQLGESLAQLQSDLKTAINEHKAVLLSPHLEKVLLFFNDKTSNSFKLRKVEIYSTNPALPVKIFEENHCREIFKKLDGRRRNSAVIGSQRSSETRAKQSATMQKKWTSGEFVQAERNRRRSPEARAKQSAIMKKKWASGEFVGQKRALPATGRPPIENSGA